ncbi:hypothetical protein IFM89_035763 [Coptis chinensis]|uniref:KIB1-4 beta-propeller domain-containing protein n=1 Tax=Coptis chinensis TaxID=261450 RepID=A0A835H9P8_9MAGN|nr:hypothetical protein IFM89_035763 [Coptis chinensis]
MLSLQSRLFKQNSMLAFTYPPSDPKCVVMLVSKKRNSITFCKIGDDKWIEQELVEFKSKKRTRIPIKYLGSVISCKGKLYLFSFDGIVVIEVNDVFASISASGKKRINCSIPEAVRKVHLNLSRELFQTLDIFKLELSTMDWVKVGNLGDRIFLLSTNSTTSLSATELGVKGN